MLGLIMQEKVELIPPIFQACTAPGNAVHAHVYRRKVFGNLSLRLTLFCPSQDPFPDPT